jgi:hypothetical protein
LTFPDDGVKTAFRMDQSHQKAPKQPVSIIKLIIVLCVLLFLVGITSMWRNNRPTPASTTKAQVPQEALPVNQSEGDRVVVSASGGMLQPQNFQVVHNSKLVLSITAMDREYSFVLPALAIDANIPQGQTVEVPVEGSELGSHQYSCGEGCTGGTIEFLPSGDDEGLSQ